MERIYNKLVRDNIPSIIKGNGATPITRILNEEEYKKELEKKLYEEYNEVLEASGEDRVEELADMIEVIKHFYTNDKMVFLLGINNEQLSHTISNYYGVKFNSYGYLNKI